jgi:hypothetical protein
MSDKPIVRYDPDGRVIEEPDLEERARLLDQREQKRSQPGAVRFSDHDREKMRNNWYGDCCVEAETCCQAMRNADMDESMDEAVTDCCQRRTLGRDLYRLDRAYRGLAPMPVEEPAEIEEIDP